MPYAYLLDDNLSDDFWKITLVKQQRLKLKFNGFNYRSETDEGSITLMLGVGESEL
jgi:hypothetical protein